VRHPLPADERDAALTALVVGVGSPHGDDRVGWEVLAALDAGLRLEPLPGVVRTCVSDRPGAGLVALLRGAQRVILVDAARVQGEPAGALLWMRPDQVHASAAASSHGFGVGQALGLARALGELPRDVRVLAISGERFDGDQLSKPVRGAVPRAVRAIRASLLGADRFVPSAAGD
jgi:hydrogenase maturation protease